MVGLKNLKGVDKYIIYLIYAILLSPRIAILPIGIGEIALRLDGVLSALLGIFLIYKLGRGLLVVPIFILSVLFNQGQSSLIFSFGLFLQIMSIFLLPYIFFEKLKFSIINKESIIRYLAYTLIYYSLTNVIIAVMMRVISFEYCLDGITSTGCIGGYGILDRPYVFSVFVGSSFVLACATKNFPLKFLIILFVGLLISDSRSIAFILVFLGFVVFVKCKGLTLNNLIASGALIAVFLLFAVFLENKINLSNLGVAGEDPSWAMRVYSIQGYFDWVDLKKIIIGDGALAFYQFSEQYGVPGPIDNLYFRLASEVGILGSVILFLISALPIYFHAKDSKNIKIFIFYSLSIGLISVFQESILVPKSGHIMFFLGVFLVSMFSSGQSLHSKFKFN